MAVRFIALLHGNAGLRVGRVHAHGEVRAPGFNLPICSTALVRSDHPPDCAWKFANSSWEESRYLPAVSAEAT